MSQTKCFNVVNNLAFDVVIFKKYILLSNEKSYARQRNIE